MKIIERMKAARYVWLSDLTPNGIMRFRNHVRDGFAGYYKISGLVFMTPRVAAMFESKFHPTQKTRYGRRMRAEQLENLLVEAERELFIKRLGPIKHLLSDLDKKRLNEMEVADPVESDNINNQE